MCCCCICCTVSDLILYIVACVVPPVAVLLRSGFFSSDFLLNVLLTLVGFLPGVIHAFIYISITSPLRRETEVVYIRQQGWVNDSNMEGVTGDQTRSSQLYNSVQTPIFTGIQRTYQSSNNNDKQSSFNPPPYTREP